MNYALPPDSDPIPPYEPYLIMLLIFVFIVFPITVLIFK